MGLSEKIGATMTKELNDKRHAEAEARAKAAKFEKAAKAAKMSDTSKSEAALQSFTAAQTKEDINKRLAEAEARAVATKKETVAKAAKMSTRKAENIKQQFEESIKAKKAADAKRHAEAEARAETARKQLLTRPQRPPRRQPRCRRSAPFYSKWRKKKRRQADYATRKPSLARRPSSKRKQQKRSAWLVVPRREKLRERTWRASNLGAGATSVEQKEREKKKSAGETLFEKEITIDLQAMGVRREMTLRWKKMHVSHLI